MSPLECSLLSERLWEWAFRANHSSKEFNKERRTSTTDWWPAQRMSGAPVFVYKHTSVQMPVCQCTGIPYKCAYSRTVTGDRSKGERLPMS